MSLPFLDAGRHDMVSRCTDEKFVNFVLKEPHSDRSFT